MGGRGAGGGEYGLSSKRQAIATIDYAYDSYNSRYENLVSMQKSLESDIAKWKKEERKYEEDFVRRVRESGSQRDPDDGHWIGRSAGYYSQSRADERFNRKHGGEIARRQETIDRARRNVDEAARKLYDLQDKAARKFNLKRSEYEKLSKRKYK